MDKKVMWIGGGVVGCLGIIVIVLVAIFGLKMLGDKDGGGSGNSYDGTLAEGDETLTSGEYNDTYLLQATDGERLTVTLRSDDFGPYMILKPPSGEQRDFQTNPDGATANINGLQLDESGQWELRVTSRNTGDVGSYELEIEGLEEEARPATGAEQTNTTGQSGSDDDAAAGGTGPVTIAGQILSGGSGLGGAVVVILQPGVSVSSWDASSAEEDDAMMVGLAVTGADGSYEIASVPRGSDYTVIVAADGYQRQIFEDGLEVTASDPARTGMNPIELVRN